MTLFGLASLKRPRKSLFNDAANEETAPILYADGAGVYLAEAIAKSVNEGALDKLNLPLPVVLRPWFIKYFEWYSEDDGINLLFVIVRSKSVGTTDVENLTPAFDVVVGNVYDAGPGTFRLIR